jgi:hypothetical protein
MSWNVHQYNIVPSSLLCLISRACSMLCILIFILLSMCHFMLLFGSSWELKMSAFNVIMFWNLEWLSMMYRHSQLHKQTCSSHMFIMMLIFDAIGFLVRTDFLLRQLPTSFLITCLSFFFDICTENRALKKTSVLLGPFNP